MENLHKLIIFLLIVFIFKSNKGLIKSPFGFNMNRLRLINNTGHYICMECKSDYPYLNNLCYQIPVDKYGVYWIVINPSGVIICVAEISSRTKQQLIYHFTDKKENILSGFPMNNLKSLTNNYGDNPKMVYQVCKIPSMLYIIDIKKANYKFFWVHNLNTLRYNNINLSGMSIINGSEYTIRFKPEMFTQSGKDIIPTKN